MKKVLKRILIVLLIILIINNFFITNISNAGIGDVFADVLESALNAVVGILTFPFRLIVLLIGYGVNSLITLVANMENDSSNQITHITPFDILFNKVELVNINFFDIDSSDDSIVMQIRTGVATWYYIMRLIALSILLVILIYVGIRMAISTVASDQARYKKMLVDWIASVVIIFLLHYIIIFVINVNNSLVNAMEDVAGDLNTVDIDNVYSEIFELGSAFADSMSIAATAIYVILVIQTFGLLISYINRFLKLAFLLIIAPLITITYSIDKMGDGKAQALNTWLKEFIFTILMQPFHCVIYLTMVSISFTTLASSIGDTDAELTNSIFAIMCVLFVKEAEKIVRKIFQFADDDSKTSMAAGMAATAVGLSQAKNIGKTARAGVTGIQNIAANTKVAATTAALNARTLGRFAFGNDTGKSFAEVKEDIKDEDEDKKLEKENKKLENRNEKVEGEDTKKYTAMERKDLDAKDQERYDEIEKQLGSKATTSRVMARLRNEKLKEKDKKGEAERANTKLGKAKKAIKGARTTLNNVRNSETFKDLKQATKTVISGGAAGFTTFAMMGSGSGLVQSGMAGAAAYGATQEFFKSSNKTLINAASNNLAAMGCQSQEDAKEQAELSKVEHDNGDYENNSNKMRELINNIKKQLEALGMDSNTADRSAHNIATRIQSNVAQGNPQSIASVCQDALKGTKLEGTDLSSIMPEAKDYSDFQNRKAFYSEFENSNATTGMTWERFSQRAISGYSVQQDVLEGKGYFNDYNAPSDNTPPDGGNGENGNNPPGGDNGKPGDGGSSEEEVPQIVLDDIRKDMEQDQQDELDEARRQAGEEAFKQAEDEAKKQMQQIVADKNTEIKALNDQIITVQAKIDSLSKTEGGADSQEVDALKTQIQQYERDIKTKRTEVQTKYVETVKKVIVEKHNPNNG